MKVAIRGYITALMFIAVLVSASLVHGRQPVRIDGGSDKSVEQSFSRMMKSLDRDQQAMLLAAIVQLNLIGISSAEEMLADPALRNPGPVQIKSRIAGLSSAEIIALANKTTGVRVVVGGQEPGVHSELLTPLDAGKPDNLLASTIWRYVSNINGFTKEETLQFEPGGTLVTKPPSTAGVSAWEQSANEVRIFINDRYAVSRGKFVDANHMQGTAGNKMGSTWTWTAERL